MKYTTRWILTVAITALTLCCLIAKDLILFMLLVYPLIAGWVVGECLNIPQNKISRSIRNLIYEVSSFFSMMSREDDARFQNDVQYFREEAGWSQSELAEQVNCSVKTIISIENGKYIPSLALASRLSEIFKVVINDLFVYRFPDETKQSKGGDGENANRLLPRSNK